MKNMKDMKTKMTRSDLMLIGVTELMAERVVKELRDEDLKELRNDPYVLMKVEGFGFIKADKIAKASYNMADEDPRRQKALIKKILADNKAFGHVFLPDTVLEKQLKKAKVIAYIDLLEKLIKEGEIALDYDRLYLPRLLAAEIEVSRAIQDRAKASRPSTGKRPCPEGSDPDQHEALETFLDQSIMIITGGPGTGKTYITNQMCQMLDERRLDYALCAPTGKAAKRMQEMTGKQAATIHRLLRAGYGTWGYNKRNKLRDYDWVIVDESSMMDLELAWRLLQALPRNTNVVFVGDKDQLSPVGPGSFFKDLINTNMIHTVILKTNHRQGRGSLIADNALRINRGERKLTFNDEEFIWIEAENPIFIREKISKTVQALMRGYPNYLEDIQVLSPQKETAVGVRPLNELLRYELNPRSQAGQWISIGDKVMQTTNDYQLNIFNGFIGEVTAKSSISINVNFFDRGIVNIPREKWNSLMLAYCCTVHKYQGSECKTGAVVVSSSHTWMLTRNLIYTAITRFKEICVLIGDVPALSRACSNMRADTRYSMLEERVRGEL